MSSSSATPLNDLKNKLQKADIDVRLDLATRLLFSTDASIYQIEPLGVVFPRSLDELAASIEVAASYRIPVLARGSGTSLAGQAIGEALILDCSRFLNRIIELNPETQSATVEPGVVLTSLNRAAAKFNLQFGPDPSSAERATLGGSLANNATGAHSILYGMAADHLTAAEVVLADGSLTTFEAVPLEYVKRRVEDITNNFGTQANTLESNIYRIALHIHEHLPDTIRSHWPRTWRRASGYNINYLLPWSPNLPKFWGTHSGLNPGLPYPPIPSGHLNLAPLIAGSEGTLGVIRRAILNLVPLPEFTALGVLTYSSLTDACDAIPDLLERGPSAVELVPQSIVRLARSVPAYATRLSLLNQLGEDPPALLMIEFAGKDLDHLVAQLRSIRQDVLVATEPAEQRQVWDIRKVGLGILASRPGDHRTTAFIEDMSVPVEYLGEFLREMERILKVYGVSGEVYGHASVGCLHIRPILNMKSVKDVKTLRNIAQEAVSLVVRIGGSVSGEHGDGLARSEWLSQMFGSEIMQVFKQLKNAADPDGILNPGKIIDPPPMDINLRYGVEYASLGWDAYMDFSHHGGFSGAVEQCNGAGVCRKLDGFMCPSFQATHDEMHSTRGRANLLRFLISGRFPKGLIADETVHEALDLCLACKGCKTECPSAVDIALLKYEFTHRYYSMHLRRSRDYIFGYIGTLARIGHPFRLLINPLLKSLLVRKFGERFIGLSPERALPVLSEQSLGQAIRRDYAQINILTKHTQSPIKEEIDCLLLSDAFTEYFYPEIGLAALRVLAAAGIRSKILPVKGAGRTFISKGFLDKAKQHAAKVIDTIAQLDSEGRYQVIGIEPSEIFTLCDEYLNLLPGDPRVKSLADRAWMIDEFLCRPGEGDQPLINSLPKINSSQPITVYLHGHCYQQARPPDPDGYPTGVLATVAMLEAVGYRVSVIDSGCCGMAGAFGYESEHYGLSMRIGELTLLPALRRVLKQEGENYFIAASGYSCQSQIKDGTGYSALHPITLISDLLT